MRRRATPKFWVFVIVTTLVIFSASFGVLRFRCNQSARQLAQVRAYRNELALQVKDLSDRLDYALTDDYIIRVARDELGMIMPGEVRYVNGAR